jgi:hypothetical protein
VSAAGVVIEGNKLAATNSAHGIYMSALTGAGMLVANNFVAVTGGAGSGILMNYNQDVALYHNSVNVLGTGKAVEPNLGSGNILIMKNNVFAAPGGGHAAYVNIAGAPTVTTDYNDYNSSGPVLAFWNANAADLAALRVASGQETHSISGNPGFASSTDLHTHAAFLNAAGTPIAAVTTDIDGEARSVTTPDIGADEFVPVAALSGTYTIGTAATYATLALAVSDLQSRGVSGPVTFQVKNGTYAQQLAITGGVAGASAANRVRFVSQSGNAADVVLQSPAVNPDLSDAVVVLTGTSFVNVEQMTLQATGVNGSGATVVGLRGRATDDRVLNCVLLDASETRFAVTAGSGAVIDRLELRRNQINGFIYGVYLYNASAANMVIEGNKLTATHPSYGLYLVSLTGAGVLVANNFVALTGGASGIEADYNQDVAFYYNSVNGPGTALTANLSGASNNLTMKNNVFARPDGAGYVVYMNVSAGAIVTTDYNDYHAQGPTIAYWNGPRATFTALQAASGQDSHSILFPAGFFSNTDLHTFSSSLDGAGTPIAGITTDIDGQTRNAVHPDIGADEFTRPNADVSDLPTIWQLATPTPNPSATEFGIAFALPSSQIVRITLFDVAGRRVFEPVPARAFEPGRYSVEVPTESLNPGLYFLRVKAGPFEGIRRVVVSRR